MSDKPTKVVMNYETQADEVMKLQAEVAELTKRLEQTEKRVVAAQRLSEHMATRAEAFWDLLQSWKASPNNHE